MSTHKEFAASHFRWLLGWGRSSATSTGPAVPESPPNGSDPILDGTGVAATMILAEDIAIGDQERSNFGGIRFWPHQLRSFI
jgi:hypothetical protein